jgi:hypothetical protein
MRGSVDDALSAYGRLLAAAAEEDTGGGEADVAVSPPRLRSGEAVPGWSEPLVVTFTLLVKRVFWSIYVQVGIATHEGTNIVLEGVDGERFPELLQRGRYEVEVALPPLWLRPKSYAARIKVIAHPDHGVTQRFYSEWIDVTVAPGDGVEVAQDRLLAPRAQWSVRSEAGANTHGVSGRVEQGEWG